MTIYPDATLMKNTHKGAKYDWYTVREDIYYSPLNITIPEGYVTDFSSVPRILWSFIPPHGKAMAASVLHDYFYTNRPLLPILNLGGEKRVKIERFIADNVFEENLISSGIKRWQARLMYWAVRIFGNSRFKRISEDEK